MQVTITGKLEEFVKRKVSEGEYENAGEAVRDALRRLEREDNPRPGCGNIAALPAQVHEIDDLLDLAKNVLDQMSEVGETESLRLQTAMDRLSKMMTTLSNILKKIDDTSQQIAQNLK